MAGPTFRIRGIAPPDLPRADRRMFWGWVVEIGLRVKDWELARGLDKDGKKLRPIRPATRKYRRSAMTAVKGRALSGPPLMPARELSRTRSLLTGRATDDAAIFYWRFDPFVGDSWGKILGYQRKAGRDVIGLSKEATARVQAEAWDRWRRYQSGRYRPPAAVASASPGIPQVGTRSMRHATLGIGVGPTGAPKFAAGRSTGGLTYPEWRRYLIQANPAPVAIPGRPAGRYNRVLANIWGQQKGAPGTKAAKTAPTPRPPVKPPTPPRATASPGAGATAPAAPVKPPTFEQALRTATAGKRGAAEMRAAVESVVRALSRPGPTGAFHGMSTPETFRTITFADTDWHYTPATESAVFQTVLDFAVQSLPGPSGADLRRLHYDLPDRLAKATKAVYFTNQHNNKDPLWRQRYPGFTVSAATGGDGSVVSYGARPMPLGRYSHESGHNLARALYGRTRPGGDYAAMLATTKEPPVSPYAGNSPAEDFAEACREYVETRIYFRMNFPERYAIIHRIMTDPSYAG